MKWQRVVGSRRGSIGKHLREGGKQVQHLHAAAPTLPCLSTIVCCLLGRRRRTKDRHSPSCHGEHGRRRVPRADEVLDAGAHSSNDLHQKKWGCLVPPTGMSYDPMLLEVHLGRHEYY